MKSKFKVIISAYNCFEWLPHCLRSIAKQSYQNYDVVVLDNASTQPGQWEWTRWWCGKHGWLAVRNEENSGPLGGLVDATRAAECDEEDIIIHIDGDDWLAHDDVFAYLDSIYSKGGVDLTYGQFAHHPSGNIGYTCPYPSEVVQNRSYREAWIRWGHLRTFRAFLWNAICDEDLRRPNGKYYRYAPDHAFMNPLIEMAGDRFCVISEVLYIYNGANPRAETFLRSISHFATEQHFRTQSVYPVHPRCR